MADIQYRNRSISQLVNELHSLGEDNVLLLPISLIAIHQADISQVKRYKNSGGDQFFIPKNHDKKYSYHQIVPSITQNNLKPMKELFEKGFNVAIMLGLPRSQGKLTQLFGQVANWMGDCACSAVQFSEAGISSSIDGSKLTERDVQNRLKYYKIKSPNLISAFDKIVRTSTKNAITLTKLRPISMETSNEVNLITFPEEFFSTTLRKTQYLSICKSQLAQIFNYMKINSANRYQHFSKVITKRLPVTNIISSLLLQQAAGFIINWINEGSPLEIQERLSIYQKFRGASVFLKKQVVQAPKAEELPPNFQIPAEKRISQRDKQKDRVPIATQRTPIAALQQQQENEMEFCRSLERKTHKYSINGDQCALFEDQQIKRSKGTSEFGITANKLSLVDEKLSRNQSPLNQSEKIAVLRSNHAIQISQYHQTIQQLNRKILTLTKQRGLQELYSLHERQLMLLQLKIKQLRCDLATLCQGADEKSFKSMVRKLNDEVKRLEAKCSEHKVAASRSTMLEKQLAQCKKKYEESQASRNKLTFELEHLTKRLKICDAEISSLNNIEFSTRAVQDAENNALDKLSFNDIEFLKHVQTLLSAMMDGNKQSRMFLIRKITNLLEDLTNSRNIILECNDFLIQLEQTLEEKLGNIEPQIVLDCNRFIRSFLMDNLSVF